MPHVHVCNENNITLQGNTTLHYAISHGNADVVSALLDTGVCDVVQQNRAGYTPIMLASLLMVSTDRHQQLVRRLFMSGDVNIMSATVSVMLSNVKYPPGY